jgi:hypothetical protein
MGRYRVGDRVQVQRAMGAPHEPATVIGTPTHAGARSLTGEGGGRTEQVRVKFDADGETVTIVADSPAVRRREESSGSGEAEAAE